MRFSIYVFARRAHLGGEWRGEGNKRGGGGEGLVYSDTGATSDTGEGKQVLQSKYLSAGG